MTLYEFNLLSEKEKQYIIDGHGVVIAYRYDMFNSYKLYHLFSFYTEVGSVESTSFENSRSFSVETLPEMYF